MPTPTPSDLHVDAPLTNVSISYMQSAEAFIAGQVFPFLPVMKQSDKYFVWDKTDLYRDEMAKRPPSTESAGTRKRLSSDSYSCDVWALHEDIDDQQRANADAAVSNLDASATRNLTQKRLIKQDREFVTDFFSTGIWTTDVVGATDFTRWDDPASDPEKDVQVGVKTILQNTGFKPNRMVVGFEVHQALKRHPVIKDRFKYTSAESITPAMLAAFFEIERYLVSEAVYNTADEGATGSYAFIAGKHCLLAHAAPAPALETPSAGYIPVWNGLTGMTNLGQRIMNFRMDPIRSDRIEIEAAWDMKKIAADLGYFFSGAVA